MSQSQSASTQPHSINPSQHERAIAQRAQKDHDGQWSCKLCDRKFNNTVRLVTHILTLCDDPLTTFSTMSAVCVCVLLDPSGSLEMFESYLRVASEEADEESSDHDSDMDTEETDDGESEEPGDGESEESEDGESEEPDGGESEEPDEGESEESDSEATISEKDDELVEEGDAGTEPWWIEEEEQEEEEEGDGLESADEDDESSVTDDQASPAARPVGPRRRNATGRGTGPPKNQDFPAVPPQSLSADQKREWTFRRDRKYPHFPVQDHHLTETGARQIRAIVTANAVPNSKAVDKAAVLSAWNSTTHARDWTANSANEKAPTTYRGVVVKYAIPT